MKKISLAAALLILLVSLNACAQQSDLDRWYQKYQSADKNNSFNPLFLLNISFAGGENSGNGAGSGSSARSGNGGASDWLRKITSLHCLSIDAAHAQEWSELSRCLRKDNFEEWFSVRKGKGRVRFLSREGKDELEELVCLIVGEEGNGLFFHLRGRFTAADKARMQAALEDKTEKRE